MSVFPDRSAHAHGTMIPRHVLGLFHLTVVFYGARGC